MGSLDVNTLPVPRSLTRSIRPAGGNRATPYRRSYVNDAVEALRSVGRSMKLKELQTAIARQRGKHGVARLIEGLPQPLCRHQ